MMNDYFFDVIPDEQTPITPEIEDVNAFIEENLNTIAAFRVFAINTSNAIGLAANQCNLNGKRFNLRLAAIKDIKTMATVIAIDPKIVESYGIVRTKAEGCLTWKDKMIVAERHHFVDVEYYTMDGELHKETHKAYQGQVWQHEINHINGVEEVVKKTWEKYEEKNEGKVQRNDLCPCGSKRKYKRCCIDG